MLMSFCLICALISYVVTTVLFLLCLMSGSSNSEPSGGLFSAAIITLTMATVFIRNYIILKICSKTKKRNDRLNQKL